MLLAALAVPVRAAEDGSALRQALPQEARELLEDTPITGADPRKTAGSLWSKGLQLLREGLQQSVRPAFLMAAVCLLLSLLESFSKTSGLTLPNRLPQLAGATAILLLAFGEQRSMAAQCRVVIEQLDRFTKLLITVFTGVSVAAGKPASAAASAGAAMLFSDGLFWLSQKLFLPMTTLFLLLTYGGSIAENGLLQKAAGLVRWGLQKLIRIFLAAYFAYLSLTGLVTGAADSAAVRTAQTLTGAVPLVGNVIASASETILAGAAALRAGAGFFGFAGALALCLTPFLQALCHLLVFRLLALLAGSYAEGGVKTMLEAVSGAYGMLLGILGACCALQFITIVVSLTVIRT